MCAYVAVLEAEHEAMRSASNTGSVAGLDDFESDGGISAVRAETGDSARACPPPVFTGAESSSSARAEVPLLLMDKSKKDDLTVQKKGGPWPPCENGRQGLSTIHI